MKLIKAKKKNELALQSRAKCGVTLLELMIVIGIIGLLSVILFRTFGSISEIAFRIEQQKNVINEVLYISQIIQNYADKNTIAYEMYASKLVPSANDLGLGTSELGTDDLAANMGIVKVLYLSGQDGKIKFFSSGDCIDPMDQLTINSAKDTVGTKQGTIRECALYLENNNGKIVQLTNPKKIYLSQIYFKIIPWASQEQYISGSGNCENENLISCINKPGFRILAQAYNPAYSTTTWGNNIRIPIHQFFNLK